MDTNQITPFDYVRFDRQMNTFLHMIQVLVEGWEDYGTQELTFDILSLSAKAARLCLMSDEDFSLQNSDITRSRKLMNLHYRMTMEMLIEQQLVPKMKDAIQRIQTTGRLEGVKWPAVTTDIIQMLPLLDGADGDTDGHTFSDLTDSVRLIEKALQQQGKPTVLPEMQSAERMWHLMNLFVRTAYLLFHFQRAEILCGSSLEDEELERLFLGCIQRCAESEKGRYELELYWEGVQFDCAGSPLTVEKLQLARRALRAEVPKNMQLCFIRHADNPLAMAKEYVGLLQAGVPISEEELDSFLMAVAKWQLVGQEIYRIEHPQAIEPPLYNEVFRTALNGKTIDMRRLKECIGQMIRHIKRKNHWFALWCVLKHHNLIADSSFEGFARQMMHPDWFASVDGHIRFSGDTLREYNGYFTQRDYKAWTQQSYQYYRSMNNKKKWSPHLCDHMLRIIIDMEEDYRKV